MTVFAAAFLAVSQPQGSMLSMDRLSLGNRDVSAGAASRLHPTTINNRRLPNSVIGCLDASMGHLIVPSSIDVDQAEVIPNSSSFKALTQRFNSSSCAYSLLHDEGHRSSLPGCYKSFIPISIGVD